MRKLTTLSALSVGRSRLVLRSRGTGQGKDVVVPYYLDRSGCSAVLLAPTNWRYIASIAGIRGSRNNDRFERFAFISHRDQFWMSSNTRTLPQMARRTHATLCSLFGDRYWARTIPGPLCLWHAAGNL
jgi:hypothetical protein